MLERAGHQVLTYRRSNDEIDTYSAVQRLLLPKTLVWASDSRREISKLLSQEKPQLVHVHNTFAMISPSIYSACHAARIPVVQTLHNYRLFCASGNFYRNGAACEDCVEHNLWRGVRHNCYRQSRAATAAVAFALAVHRQRQTWNREITAFIALSEFARQRYINAGLMAEKVFVKPNFVHPDPGERRGDGQYALFVGRLVPEKGLRTLLRAWSLLREPIPLSIVGDGPLRKELEAEAVRLKLSQVEFRGWLAGEQRQDAFEEARFLVFPSEAYEGFPLTIAEAFARGVPVVAARLGAAEEIVRHERTGLHFRSGNAEDLACKVRWAWTQRERLRTMGKEARQIYETTYTAELNYPMLIKIYSEAMGSSATPNVGWELRDSATRR